MANSGTYTLWTGNTWGSVSIRSSHQQTFKHVLSVSGKHMRLGQYRSSQQQTFQTRTSCERAKNVNRNQHEIKPAAKHSKDIRAVNDQMRKIRLAWEQVNGEAFRALTFYQRAKHARLGQHAVKQMVKHFRYIQSIDEANERGLVSMRSSKWWNISGTYTLINGRMRQHEIKPTGKGFEGRTPCEWETSEMLSVWD
jgi:hypothetical protein